MDNELSNSYVPRIEGKREEFQLGFVDDLTGRLDEVDMRRITFIANQALAELQKAANLQRNTVQMQIHLDEAYKIDRFISLMAYHRIKVSCPIPKEWGTRWFAPDGVTATLEYDPTHNSLIKSFVPSDIKGEHEKQREGQLNMMRRITTSPRQNRGLGEVKCVIANQEYWTSKTQLRSYCERFDRLFEDEAIARKCWKDFESDPFALDSEELKTCAKMFKISNSNLSLMLVDMWNRMHQEETLSQASDLQQLIAMGVIANFYGNSTLWNSFLLQLYQRQNEFWSNMVPLRLLELCKLADTSTPNKKDNDLAKPSLQKWVDHFFNMHPKYAEWIKTNGLNALSAEEAQDFYAMALRYKRVELATVVRERIGDILTDTNIEMFATHAIGDEALATLLANKMCSKDNVLVTSEQALKLYREATNKHAPILAAGIRERVQKILTRDNLQSFLDYANGANDALLMKALCAVIKDKPELLSRKQLSGSQLADSTALEFHSMLNAETLIPLLDFAHRTKEPFVNGVLNDFMNQNDKANHTQLKTLAEPPEICSSGENSPNNSSVVEIKVAKKASTPHCQAWKLWKQILAV